MPRSKARRMAAMAVSKPAKPKGKPQPRPRAGSVSPVVPKGRSGRAVAAGMSFLSGLNAVNTLGIVMEDGVLFRGGKLCSEGAGGLQPARIRGGEFGDRPIAA